tara:strand:+ start:259 stop:528 length:270 start_codon:yes stop_codon:yes gene_type:complete
MPSIKFLKKEVNNSIGEIIKDVYAWELSIPDSETRKRDLIVDKAISLFDDLIFKIHKNRTQPKNNGFKIIREDLNSAIIELNNSLSKLD